MPLINLTTNLKGLGFGHDKPEGNSSREPYIQIKIPATDESLQRGSISPGNIDLSSIKKLDVDVTLPSIKLPNAGTGGPDFLLRGGALLPNRIINDLERIGKLIIDTKSWKGLLFTIKQNLLSRVSPETEASFGLAYAGGGPPNDEKILRGGALKSGIYTPLSTLGQVVGNAFGIHLNKDGLDPTGLVPNILAIRTYESLFRNSKGEPTFIDTAGKNRLVKLYKQKMIFSEDDDKVADVGKNVLYRYGGGPGSILGIGFTKIRIISSEQRTSYDELYNKFLASNQSYQLNDFFRSTFYDENITFIPKWTFNGPNFTEASIPFNSKNLGRVVTIKNVYDQIANRNFITYNISPTNKETGQQEPEAAFKVSKFNGGKGNWFDEGTNSKGERYVYDGYQTDRFDGLKIIESDDYQEGESSSDILNNDIVNFIFEIIDPGYPTNQRYFFPSYIELFDDGYTIDWKAEKFMGRGEDFYTYNGFSREMSMNFKTYARNPVAMAAMYNNLQQVIAALTPKYSTQGFMQGNLFRLTVGSYLVRTPVVITSFKINEVISEKINWEINNKFSMPYIFDINMQFKPIYETLPSINNPTFISGKIYDNINQVGKKFVDGLSKYDEDTNEISFEENRTIQTNSDNENLTRDQKREVRRAKRAKRRETSIEL